MDTLVEAVGLHSSLIKETKNNHLWPDGKIHYLNLLQNAEISATLNAAMQRIENTTCIRFIPYEERKGGGKTFVKIIPAYRRCSSTIGRNPGNVNMMMLDVQRCNRLGVLMHELLHVIGFYHEHSRPDRDYFVRVNWDNIQPCTLVRSNIETHTWAQFLVNTQYDYNSIMHYPNNGYAKKAWMKTILPYKPIHIGQRNELSEWDIFKVNKLYQCVAHLGLSCKDKLERSVCIKEGLKERQCDDQNWAAMNCILTCGLCRTAGLACEDRSPICSSWARRGMCDGNSWQKSSRKSLIKKWCAKSCNQCK